MNSNTERIFTTSSVLTNGWYIKLHTGFVTFKNDYSLFELIEIFDSNKKDATELEYWDGENFIYEFFTRLDDSRYCDQIASETVITRLIIEQDRDLFKEMWKEHNFLTTPIKNALNEYYKK